MSQQNLDLRRSVQIARRHKKLIGAVAALGLLIGVGYAFLRPPLLSSVTLVVLADSSSAQSTSQASSTGVDSAIATQEVIATSDPVLAEALPQISPTMSLQTLQNRISVASVDSSNVLSFTGMGTSAGQAEATANAVANSYVAYVGAATSDGVHAAAKVIEPATTAAGRKLPEQMVIYALLGALAGAVVGFIIALALGRGDRRLVERDAIANSIAAPVLVSLPVAGRPSDPASWTRMLDEYEPDPVHAYGLSKLLNQLGVGDYGATNGGQAGSSLTVLSLSTDPTALALGPQLAAFASAQGVPTALVVGPQQDANVTATLRTACAATSPFNEGRAKPLRLLASEDGSFGQLRASFTVVVAVVDGQDPQIPKTTRTGATMLGVSAGGATAEQLARAATAAALDGREIDGILVANPDPDDQTSGRIPHLRPLRRAVPTRVNGLSTEIRQ
jgi:capsular polysaccharide biosynthesis protein